MLIEAVPVKFVTVPLAGVPSAGVTRVGEVFSTTEPVPVDVVTPVPPLATGRTPVVEVTDAVTKSAPFQTTTAVVPAAMVTPVVGPAPTILTAKPPVVELIIV